MKEILIAESFQTLQAQVDALARETNPVVFFPVGTKKLPSRPDNAKSVSVPGDALGCGVYYYLPRITTAKIIVDAVEQGCHGKLLGFIQRKEDALKGSPGLVVARDLAGGEIKSAVVDVNNAAILAAQSAVFAAQFPGAKIKVEPMQMVLRDRLLTEVRDSVAP